MLKSLVVGFIAISIGMPPSVFASEEAFSRLLAANSLKCTFKEGVETTWEARGVKIRSEEWKGDTHFDSINIKEGRARVIGNQGVADVRVIASPSGFTFVETTGVGNMVFATVFPHYKSGTDQFLAVMSRHMNFLRDAVASQYYGTCTVWGS